MTVSVYTVFYGMSLSKYCEILCYTINNQILLVIPGNIIGFITHCLYFKS